MACENEEWRRLLEREVENDPRGKAGVAEKLSVSRAYVSRVLSRGASRIAPSRRFLAKIEAVYGRVDCPWLGRGIPRGRCYQSLGPAPVHNPAQVMQWRACQKCPLKPDGGESWP